MLYEVITILTAPVFAQRTLDYDHSVVNQTRIDMRDLGYPPIDVIPSDESAVRALTVAPNGAIYGVTGGKRSHLFVLFPVHGYVQPLGYRGRGGGNLRRGQGDRRGGGRFRRGR